MEGGRHVVTVALLIVVGSVGRRHSTVVVAQGNEGSGRGSRHLHVVAVQLLQLLHVALGVVFAQEVIVRPFVRKTGVHRDDGIEENLEVGLRVAFRVSGDSRGQMTTSRRAHDTHLLRVNVPLLGVAAHHTDGLLGIADGDLEVSARHAIFQDDKGNTLLIEERCPVGTLMRHSQMAVTTTRTAHYGTSSRLLGVGQEDGNLGCVRGIAVRIGCIIRPEIKNRPFLRYGCCCCHHHCC